MAQNANQTSFYSSDVYLAYLRQPLHSINWFKDMFFKATHQNDLIQNNRKCDQMSNQKLPQQFYLTSGIIQVSPKQCKKYLSSFQKSTKLVTLATAYRAIARQSVLPVRAECNNVHIWRVAGLADRWSTTILMIAIRSLLLNQEFF